MQSSTINKLEIITLNLLDWTFSLSCSRKASNLIEITEILCMSTLICHKTRCQMTFMISLFKILVPTMFYVQQSHLSTLYTMFILCVQNKSTISLLSCFVIYRKYSSVVPVLKAVPFGAILHTLESDREASWVNVPKWICWQY